MLQICHPRICNPETPGYDSGLVSGACLQLQRVLPVAQSALAWLPDIARRCATAQGGSVTAAATGPAALLAVAAAAGAAPPPLALLQALPPLSATLRQCCPEGLLVPDFTLPDHQDGSAGAWVVLDLCAKNLISIHL